VSNNLALSQVAAAQNQKEVTINDQAGQLDAALTASLPLAINSSNARTLTSTELRRHFFFDLDPDGGDAPDAAITLTVPSGISRGQFAVVNDTGFDVTVEITGQALTPPTIADGQAALLTSDGVNVRLAGGGGSGGGGSSNALMLEPVRVVAFANVDISTGLEAGDAVNGVTLVAGDRVLLAAQTDASENGVYVASASGAATRATDMDASGEVVQGLIIPVTQGSAYARTLWMVTTDTSSFTLDTDSLAIEVMPVAGAYDIGFFYGGGPPGSSELIFKHVAARDFQLPGNFFGSEGHVGTNPTATFDMDVQLEGVSIGTISVSTSGVFTFTTTSGTAKDVAAGERLEIIGPSSADATVADIGFTLAAVLT
jgi:hypothetical protein